MFLFKSSANNEETTTKTECKSKFPFVRPKESERKFVSPVIEKVIKDITSNMKDKDLARLFENCWPNTLDTTVAWFNVGEDFPRTFIVTKLTSHAEPWRYESEDLK
ncbi:unnamed protein product [Rhizophagus irregularis]|nr:unnamed protein product [Rhizophagus irregularis]CAB4434146.1 unnamed protein product [Rhizophagus irregularis]